MQQKDTRPFTNISWSNATAASQALESYGRKEWTNRCPGKHQKGLEQKGIQPVSHVVLMGKIHHMILTGHLLLFAGKWPPKNNCKQKRNSSPWHEWQKHLMYEAPFVIIIVSEHGLNIMVIMITYWKFIIFHPQPWPHILTDENPIHANFETSCIICICINLQTL